MRSIPQACSDDRAARARQGALSAAEWQEFASHLATCADCRITWRLMVDFEQSAAPAPGDERLLGCAAKLALAGSRSRRVHVFRVGVAAAVILLVAGVASGAILLRARHVAVSADLTDSARTAGMKARRAAASSAAQPVAPEKSAAFLATEPAPPAPSGVAQPPMAVVSRSAHPSRKPIERATGHLASVAPDASPRAVALDPSPVENASILFARAVSEREQGRTSSAIATFRSLQRRFSKTPQAVLSLVSLADLLLGTGDAATALVAFEEYLAAAPSGALVPEALLGKARALSALGRAAEAEAVWREIARRYPDSPYVGRRIGTRSGGDTP
jgi:TolA-binding protein